MIPLRLRISGFLSYRDPVELDFDSFDLACISGHNGAGKSSLLDAFTWVLFGEARGKSADIINLNSDVKAAEVALTFKYEGNVFRVQRTLPRNKSTLLEFQVLDEGEQKADLESGTWKPLTEKTTRDTQARIEQTLRLDYDTFINASFFLQGKADEFTQKKAGDRKAVLSSILGLEVWDEYKDRAADKRKIVEREVDEIDGRIAEIDSELAEEDARKARLAELETTLGQLSTSRAAQEAALANIRKNADLLNEQRKLTEALSTALERARTALLGLEKRLAEKESERTAYTDLVHRAKEIESSYKAWQKTRKELESLDQIAMEFREHEKERTPLLEQIATEKARLEEERRSLLVEQEEIENQSASMGDLTAEVEKARTALQDAEIRIAERTELDSVRNDARERQAFLKAENDALKENMNSLKERMDSLDAADGATCPLCGQELTEKHRKATVKQLEAEGKQKGDKFRANKSEMDQLEKTLADCTARLAKLTGAENDRLKFSNTISQLTERIETLGVVAKEWEKSGKKRLAEVTKVLEKESFAADARKGLAKLDKELAKLGYDVATHEETRQQELELREVEEEYRKLESARELSKRIAKEIDELEEEIKKKQAEVSESEEAHRAAAQALAESESHHPNLDDVERDLFALREDENRIRDQVGAARQKVEVLATLRGRKADYAVQREELNQQIVRYKTLERAFGKDGVPALLIEQALPQIEQKANDLLDRLSDGQMSIRFVTQAEYKDKKRDDLRETLDIQISDSAGQRDYEMYSGGEAFRVNFAIRLALSEILSQRKGARLQTLVIDEGFGSQDAQGRQRLIEAINLIKQDFAKILVITHLDELKDAFPNRIEIEKTERGSAVKVV
ncbi:MAG TPA: SMC family ATPase [Anaerolineales bacterium]|nr:SMC family ATPase [Anaerolineales bacterium]HNA52829.1 SMC family ATPase [Anaerolineales bacterium]HND92643.1 SMC family ATPase [Anaerolineales bacterium]HNF33331.1 SMC family ATPase [Anaerolineales bacterium]HNH04953.1 SMC family ATPase [Anaerolineales bacterium]